MAYEYSRPTAQQVPEILLDRKTYIQIQISEGQSFNIKNEIILVQKTTKLKHMNH